MLFGEGAVEVVNVADVLLIGLTRDVEEAIAVCLDVARACVYRYRANRRKNSP
jgi:hypothetical protein